MVTSSCLSVVLSGAAIVVSVGALVDFLHLFLLVCFCFVANVGMIASTVLITVAFLGAVSVSCPVLAFCFFLVFLPPLWFLRLLRFGGEGVRLLPTASTMLIAGFERLTFTSSAFMLELG